MTATISGMPVKPGNFDFKLNVKVNYTDTDDSFRLVQQQFGGIVFDTDRLGHNE